MSTFLIKVYQSKQSVYNITYAFHNDDDGVSFSHNIHPHYAGRSKWRKKSPTLKPFSTWTCFTIERAHSRYCLHWLFLRWEKIFYTSEDLLFTHEFNMLHFYFW